jgi:hypothetical protein
MAYLASVEYHFPFTAAIVLQLARLLPSSDVPEDDVDIKLLLDYLQQAGDKGSESAADCRNMVVAFGATVTRLLHDAQLQQRNPSSVPVMVGNSAVGDALDMSESSIFRRDMFLSGAQMMSSNGMPLDIGSLGEGQAAAYEELLSWFSDSLC